MDVATRLTLAPPPLQELAQSVVDGVDLGLRLPSHTELVGLVTFRRGTLGRHPGHERVGVVADVEDDLPLRRDVRVGAVGATKMRAEEEEVPDADVADRTERVLAIVPTEELEDGNADPGLGSAAVVEHESGALLDSGWWVGSADGGSSGEDWVSS